MLMLLQERGRVTAGELAAELEVSPRTVLRDVGALVFAGVPIRTVRGSDGGIELREGFRTELTGLNSDEAAWLLLAGLPQIAAALGVAMDATTARRKLLQALAPEHRARAVEIERWLHLDIGAAAIEPPEDRLARIAAAIQDRLTICVRGADAGNRRLDPLGLVASAEGWHVIVAVGGREEALNVAGIEMLRVTADRFERPDDFDLADAWTRARS